MAGHNLRKAKKGKQCKQCVPSRWSSTTPRRDHEFSVRPRSEFSSAFRSFSSHKKSADDPYCSRASLTKRLCESLYLLFAVVSLHTARTRLRKIPSLAM